MDNQGDDRKVPFTYIWAVENYSEPIHLTLQSPSFVVDSIEKTKWCLVLYVNPHCVLCYIARQSDSSGLKSMEIDFELAILADDGTPISEEKEVSFTINHHSKIQKLIENSVLYERRAEILPKNTLTIRCRMWRKEFSINSEDLCFARSKLRIERTSFMWPVTDFKGLAGDKTCKRVHPIPDKKPVMDYILRLNQNDGEEEVRVEIDVEGGRGYSIFGEISVLDAEGRIIDLTKIKSRLHLDQTNIQFPMLTTKSKLMADEYLCLPNETLLLRCALEIFIGVSLSRIEYCTFLPSLNTEDFLNAEKQNEVDEEEFAYCSGPCPLKQALLNLYKDGSFSDVTLKAGTESFNVHKNILSVRSPVFKAMFTGNEELCTAPKHKIVGTKYF
ncbi:uncharacterized protein CDAR_112651 [Caerostris darwini]|uniref:BTB domain-containing protein n=1 Tax=Caerostris darwini TaxID=1538125 RepID=A0AAV4Q1N5_9ARAC|nr:uncharacterized protein CDAR_112651 [Caerostris darwini]